jgi:glycosyltransferase involved in cell wall biosynthesis
MSHKPTLAIVSSYNVNCGNASYTHALKEEFAQYFDVTVIPINFHLLSNSHARARKIAQSYLKDLARALPRFDYVNVQFEAGLFGIDLINACQNVIPLIKACQRVSFTIHRVFYPVASEPFWKGLVKHLIMIRRLPRYLYTHLQAAQFEQLIDALANHPAGTIIVHTRRDRDHLETYYQARNVLDYPVTFLRPDVIAQHVDHRAAIRAEFLRQYQLEAHATYIGLFGYLSENKGHHTALNALNYLPDTYKILIFGAQHPLAIKDYDLGAMLANPLLFQHNNNRYVSSLVTLAGKINKKYLSSLRKHQPPSDQEELMRHYRVRFMGGLKDTDFLRAITAMDFIALPYFETGQGGSGNASLILELKAKAIFARNHAFLELAQYYHECFEFADIGNSLEIAQKIQFWHHDLEPQINAALQRYNIAHNVRIQAELMLAGHAAAERLKQDLVG